ncbi:MAG: hypothetical protein WA940_11385 [Sphingopyxis sp.]
MASTCCWPFFAAMLLAATPVAAQEPLPTTAGKPWTHAHSGIVIPAALDELPRVRATSFAAPELDISQNFASGDGRESLTVYIFRDTNGAVPVWFAQAVRAIALREDLKAPPYGIAPVAFSPPGQPVASGLKAVFAPVGVEGVRSTGVALFAVGGWYVKLRANSATLAPGDLSEWMEGVLGELTLPRGAPAAAVQPVADCGPGLHFQAAAVDASRAATAPAPRLAAARWCLDSVVAGNQAVYRPDGARDRYLLAAGDNGKGFSVQPQAGHYAIDFVTPAQTFLMAAQDRMPAPQRVLDLAKAGRSTGAVATWPKP